MARTTVVIFIWLFRCSLGANYEGCESPQYLQYGKSGVIDCFFHKNFTSIFWYDSTNIVRDKPIVTLINSVKGGEGYISGKFDISSNGSLIITEVGVGHGKNFTVAKFASLDLDHGDVMMFVVTAVIIGVINDECDSPQYLEYGRNGTVQCHFLTNFLRLLWYNSTDIVEDAPIVTYSRSVKSGRGFESGEFNIFSNGSLSIHEVGLVHEHNYTVAKFTGLNEEPTLFVIRVIVTVKSLLEGPVIDRCESNGTICFTELDGSSAVNCIVQGVRPAVSLKWLTLTGSGHHYISSNMSLISNNVTFTSHTETSDAFVYSPVLSLLVCKAEFASDVLQRDKSFVLVQNSQRNLSSIPPMMKYAPLGSTLELFCADSIIPHLQVVWKRSPSFDNQYQNLMFRVFNENHFETNYNDHFQFGENGSLILRQVDPQHDGFYGCIYGDGITDGMIKYKVVTYAKEPDDPSAIIVIIVIVMSMLVVAGFCGMASCISGYLYRKRRMPLEASFEDNEIRESLPVPHSDKGNQSSSGNFARNEKEQLDYESLQFLSRHLGSDWKNVARLLLLEDSEVHRIEADFCGSSEAPHSMLMLWKSKNGSHATFDTLIEALESARRKDLVDLMQCRKNRYRTL